LHRRFANSRRRLLHRPAQNRVRFLRLRRRKARRLLINYHRVLQLSVKFREILLLLRVEIHHRSRNRSRRTRRPSRRRNCQCMLRRTHHPRGGLPARPRALHRPALEMRVHRPILREHVPRPLVRLLELRRTRQPRPHAVRQIFEVGRRLAVLANLAQNLRVRRRERILLIGRPCHALAHRSRHQHHATHQHAPSTQAHSSTSNPFWIFSKGPTTRQSILPPSPTRFFKTRPCRPAVSP